MAPGRGNVWFPPRVLAERENRPRLACIICSNCRRLCFLLQDFLLSFIFHVTAVSDLRLEDESVHVTERYTGRRGETAAADRTHQCVSCISSTPPSLSGQEMLLLFPVFYHQNWLYGLVTTPGIVPLCLWDKTDFCNNLKVTYVPPPPPAAYSQLLTE